ncbi:MAG: AbrB/MazE/SpoVT family DNA-binding domain-containing protein [Lentisphaeria bacterium]|nr:AbrB/MazE/SpoVT family DNA-binding domain-containing protein [Lentisphaeria bacterium]
MKTLTTTVTDRGQISIPAKIRKDLRLKPGARLIWREVSDHECLVTVQDESDSSGAVAMLGFSKQFRETRRTDTWMAELREGDEGDD